MSKRIAIIDVAVVGGAALLYVALEGLDIPKRWSFVTIGLALALYAIYLARGRVHAWRELGFRGDNLAASAVPVGICTLLAAGGLVLWAATHGTVMWNRDVLVLLALYPAWAVVQQLAFQGLLHRGLMVLVPSPAVQVLVVAAAFASVHAGNPTLAGLTFVAGICWSLLYRRWPNLWVLAASHTVLAALAYPLVLADAPLSRL